MNHRTRLAFLSGLLFLAGALHLSVSGCRPTAATCVAPEHRERPEGWTCGKSGESTECYDGSQCTLDICQDDGACANPVRTGDCDAGAGWHGVCRSDGACCPRPAGTVDVSVSVPFSSTPVASSVAAPR